MMSACGWLGTRAKRGARLQAQGCQTVYLKRMLLCCIRHRSLSSNSAPLSPAPALLRIVLSAHHQVDTRADGTVKVFDELLMGRQRL